MPMNRNISDSNAGGLLAGISSYLIWGSLPVYWKALKHVPAREILAHRILWAFFFLLAAACFSGQIRSISLTLRDRRRMLILSLCALLIALNWGLYIWAVNSGRLVETSLGYYINSLISFMLGVLILREKTGSLQKMAFLLACCPKYFLTAGSGHAPWLPLLLALSFAAYGFLKKLAGAPALTGLLIETFILAPASACYILFTESGGAGHMTAPGASSFTAMLLFFGGFVTALPLLLFAHAANRIPLSLLGFTQYLSPTITLILGVILYGEPFDSARMMTFAIIWFSLFLYSISFLRMEKAAALERREQSGV
jgi:chloramphenicol-sensitive protein RarD